MSISLSRYLVEQQRAKGKIPPELRLLLEVVARACKSISHAVNKGALGGVLGSGKRKRARRSPKETRHHRQRSVDRSQ